MMRRLVLGVLLLTGLALGGWLAPDRVSAQRGPAQPSAGLESAASRLGLEIETLTAARAAEFELLVGEGVVVLSVEPGGPAGKADLKRGDAITLAGTRSVKSVADLDAAVAEVPPGQAIALVRHRAEHATRRLQVELPPPPRPAPVVALPQPQGEPVLMLDTGGHMALLRMIEFTHDGRHLVSAGEDKVVRVWEWATGRTVRTFRGEVEAGNPGKIYAMALSPPEPELAEGHRWLAVGGYVKSDDNEIRLYDFASGRLVRLFKGHDNIVNRIAFSPDGRWLISSSSDRTAIIWNVESGQIHAALRGHTGDIRAVGFTPDGQRVVTAGNDKTLRLWEARNGRLITTMTGHAEGIRSLAVNPRDGTIASGGFEGDIRLWDGRTGRAIRLLANQGTVVGSLSFNRDGTRLLSTCGQGHPCEDRVWNVETGERIATHKIDNDIVLTSAITPDGRNAATGGGNNHEIRVWDLATGERRRRFGQPLALAGSGRAVWATGFSMDGRTIAWGNFDGGLNDKSPIEFQLRLPGAGERLGQPQPITPADARKIGQWRRAVVMERDLSLSHRASTGEYARVDGLLDIKRGETVLASIGRGPSDGFRHRSYTFSPDGQVVVSGGANGYIASYTPDGKRIGEFVGHQGDIWAVTISPDGRYLLSGSADQTMKLWNIARRELVVTLFHGNDGEWVMWTPQGYYTGSPRGGELVGWQQNYGADKEARYVQAGRLRHMLRRPEIVERAIVLADAAAAVGELATGGPALAELVRRPPPDIWLKGDEATATGRARLVLEIERTGRPVTAYDVHLGNSDGTTGQFVPERRLVHRPIRIPSDYKPQFPDRELIAFEVDLREGSNLVAVVARTDVGETTTVPTQVISRADALGTQDGVLRVLAIGVDRYPGAVPYPGNLTFAGKDARDFAETARRTMGARHQRVETEVLYNGAGGGLEPTKANIEAALKRLSSASAKDTVVLFIAGHGESRQGQYVVLPTDHRRSRPDDPGQNVVDWRTIREALASTPGRRLVFLDTCHAGNAYNDALSGDARVFAFAAFTAAPQGAIAQEDPALGQGRFTHAVRLGLQGEAMTDNAIEVYDLGRYLSRKVRELSKGAQEAEFFPGAGNFVLVRR